MDGSSRADGGRIRQMIEAGRPDKGRLQSTGVTNPYAEGYSVQRGKVQT